MRHNEILQSFVIIYFNILLCFMVPKSLQTAWNKSADLRRENVKMLLAALWAKAWFRKRYCVTCIGDFLKLFPVISTIVSILHQLLYEKKNNILLSAITFSCDIPRKCYTAQKIKFSIKDFFSKCDQILSFLGFGHIYGRNP